MSFSVYRYDIINHLIKKNNYKSYLEIGVRHPNAGCFNKIKINSKLGVDPNPLVNQDNIYIGTSDIFFKNNNKTFDIIFIDGLHLEEQVDKDVVNALNCLNENGTVLLHDCNPPTAFHQRKEYDVTKRLPWNGTVWRSLAKLRMTRDDLNINVVDTDWGVGIIRKSNNEQLFPLHEDFTYDLLENNRNELLNLISTKSFYKLY